MHTGVDLNLTEDADRGKPIVSISDGTVTFAGYLGKAWGDVIVINHGSVFARYAHVSGIRVRAGDKVTVGQHIADVGNARGKWSYHFHFDISHTEYSVGQPCTLGKY